MTFPDTFWQNYWKQFKKHRLGYFALWIVFVYCLVGVYAPFLASSKPLIAMYQNHFYFPLFRYLFYPEFFTKQLDIFFNIFMFILPLMVFVYFMKAIRRKGFWLALLTCLQGIIFLLLVIYPMNNPAGDLNLLQTRIEALNKQSELSWNFDLQHMSPYAQLNMILRYRVQKEQFDRLKNDLGEDPSTLFHTEKVLKDQEIERLEQLIENSKEQPDTAAYESAIHKMAYLQDKWNWLEKQNQSLKFVVMPLFSHFHWEDDAGGEQSLNQKLPWWDLTRINRKDLLSALIFGTRISLVVGLLAVAIALAIAVPVGAAAGYYGGKVDIVVCRLLEIWEAMPTFFMLLMIVAILQSKSIFIVIAIIGFFGWTGFSRYIRGEFLKQRNLPYIEACHALGYRNNYIMFIHILPNAVLPLLTLLPFAIMGAISSEAGLSFLGLGEENSCSWGVLMNEGRAAFPGESHLLWPPAFLLTFLLVAIALVGDALRDTFDPKLHKA
ncbi:MAG: ABC transporter permease [Parachlamydiaceae bacterium]